MAEYIEREALINSFRSCGASKDLIDAIVYRINLQEAADVAPVQHGRWIHERTEGGFHIWRCNQCGRGMNNNPEGTDLYCYHCGAKMDEVSE